MALLELDAGENYFDAFIEIRRDEVEVFQPLLVVGLRSDNVDVSKIYGVNCDVITKDAGALLQASYPSQDGLSSSAVIVSVDTCGGCTSR